MEAIWNAFCHSSGCLSSSRVGAECSMNIPVILNPFSCINHIMVMAIDSLLLFISLLILVWKSSSEKNVSLSRHFSSLMISVAGINGGLSLCYLGLAVWKIYRNLSTVGTVLPLHEWLVVLSQGITWLILCLTVSFKTLARQHAALMKFCTLVASLYAGFICISSVWEVIVDGVVSMKGLLDILSFPGGILMLISAFPGQSDSAIEGENHGLMYEPLLENEANTTDEKNDGSKTVTPFAKAGFFSKTSFWWLNPLMKKGKQKVLQQDDVPLLRPDDRAGTCYSQFMEEVRKQKKESSDMSSVLWALFNSQRKAILITGIFALVKVLMLATGPLFLMAFIKVTQGEAGFDYEVFVLTAGLFLAKCIETLSERQWNFGCRLIGLQVRSFLSAAVCKKQLRLSNAAKMSHSPGEIINNVLVDTYQIGEFPYWFHQIWSTSLQLVLALLIVYYAVGFGMVAALVVIILTVLLSSPMAKLQQKYQRKLVETQDRMLKAVAEALANMKVLKLYAWETRFKNVIEGLRKDETEWTKAVLAQRGYYMVLYWSSPVLVPACTFWACYFLGIPLTVSNVFTFLASLRIVQEPIRLVPDVVGAFVQANVALSRVINFLNAPELEQGHEWKRTYDEVPEFIMLIKASEISWSHEKDSSKITLRNINLEIKAGEKVAVCGEVGSGKSTLLAAILGEVPHVNGTVQVYGRIAYVSQTAWIQTGTIRDNILFGSPMDPVKYQETIQRCCLVKDIEMLPFGNLTLIGERGVNLSGGQKQRIQLARALYQDADLYLLDDPFSAVDAHTAASLFNEYVMGALCEKTVLLVTHQVDFLPSFSSILMMSSGEIIGAGSYDHLMASCPEFGELVNAHNFTSAALDRESDSSEGGSYSKEEIQKIYTEELLQASRADQLIKQEERETGDTGLKPYIQYLKHKNGLLHFTLATTSHIIFIVGQLIQNYWLAVDINNPAVSTQELNMVYTAIGVSLALFLLLRSYFTVLLGVGASESMFNTLICSLFRAPMSFYDSTPVGRILSRVSSDLNVVDTDVPFKMAIALGSIMIAYSSFLILILLTWQIVFVIVPMIYLTLVIQKYYLATSKELMRLDGTTKSMVASQLSESIAGATTIRAFGMEERFFQKCLDLIDANASAHFHNFAANEWLILRLELVCAVVLSSSALAITLLNRGASASGFIGMALTYGLSLNVFLVLAIQWQCLLSNLIVSVERLEQYMHIPSEAPEVIEDRRPAQNWPSVGKVDIYDLKVRYRPEAPLVLRGITCTIQGGHKIGIVGRTGSGKTTLISTLFRLVEPTEGKIIIDDINITSIGLHDLRSHFGVIPQEPTLFGGTVRYNLDPLSEHTDDEIWDVLGKCQLRETIQQKEKGLDSLVVQDGSNWSMGQRQLFCLGRALLRRSRILVLDEATASIDNATDSILQRTIRREFADCTVITVAHRIPTVMDCTMVLAISDGRLVEYDDPMKLINKEESLFGQLYMEFWSRSANSRN